MKRKQFIILLVLIAGFSGAAEAQWTDNGSSITTTDNVGLNIINPSSVLDVYTADGNSATGLVISQGNASGNNHSGRLFFENKGDVTSSFVIMKAASRLSLRSSGEAGQTSGIERMSVLHNGRVGIGTTTPSRKFEVEGNIALDKYAIYSAGGSSISFGDTGIGIANESDDIGINIVNDGELEVTHTGKNAFNVSDSRILLGREGNMNVGIGTKNPTSLLAVDGTTKTKEIIVTEQSSDWPDYVFTEAGDRRPELGELEAYINKHDHLPGIPTKEEIERDGQNLGKVQAKLLEKIEEITLYVIELEKRIKELEKEKK